MLHLDPQNAYHARVRHRLRHDVIIWLTTIGPDGKPQPSPVWFLWDGQHSVRLYSRPGTGKLRNIADRPQVSLNFDSDERGGDIVVFTGVARQVVVPTANLVPEYLEKYHAGILRIGMDHAGFGDSYDACIEVTLETLRGH